MATATKSPDDLSPGTNPGQDEFDKLNERYAVPGSHDNKPSGDSSDPRGDDGSQPADQTTPKGDSSDPRGTPNKDDLASSESSASPHHDNQVGAGYKKSDAQQSRFSGFVRNRKKIIGGGLAGGAIGAIVLLGSFLSGPLEFIHFGELLTQFHLTDNQNFSDGRTIRNILYTINHKGNRTRLGRITNKYADKWEDQLVKQVGLKPLYTKTTNRFAGFEVTDEDLASEQLSQFDSDGINTNGDAGGLVDTNGTPADGSKRIVQLTDKQFNTRRSVVRSVGKATDTSKVISSLASRLLIKRGGIDFHPLKNIIRNKLDSLTAYNNKVKDEAAEEAKTGIDDNIPKSTAEKDKQGQTNKDDQDASDGSNSLIDEAEAAGAEGAEGQSTLDALKSSFTAKAAGPTIVIGVLCSVKAFGNNIPDYEYANVALPEMRMGFRVITTESQIQSGQDVNGDELGALAQSFDDPVTKTSWTDARSIQAELGQPQSGPDIPNSAKPGDIGVPKFFSIINKIPFLGTACFLSGGFLSSIPVLGSVASFTSDQIFSGINFAIKNTVGSAYTVDNLLNDALGLVAGGGANVFAQGAEFGNLANYGARLGANDQALSEGGRALTTPESNQLSVADQQQSQADFQSHNIAYRLFDPYDYRTAISKVIDQSSSSPTQNISRIASTIINLPHTFGMLPGLLGGTAHAATPTNYDYGFPEYGFSAAEQSDNRFSDPFDNADIVENQLGLAKLNAKYGVCFSMTVDPTTGALVNGTAVNYSNIAQKHPECNDGSEALLRYRFYLADTVTAKSLACYEGDDESCSELGFPSSGASGSTTPQTGFAAPATDTSSQVSGENFGQKLVLSIIRPKGSYENNI